MVRQVNHLVRLVDDLLDVSRISRGKIALRKEQRDLAEIVDAALEISQSGLGRGDRRRTLELPSGRLVVEGDRVRWVELVANLLNNAAKFTDPGGHIALRVLHQGERVEIQVRTTGGAFPASGSTPRCGSPTPGRRRSSSARTGRRPTS
jgi:signal transduction histidine kinase